MYLSYPIDPLKKKKKVGLNRAATPKRGKTVEGPHLTRRGKSDKLLDLPSKGEMNQSHIHS